MDLPIGPGHRPALRPETIGCSMDRPRRPVRRGRSRVESNRADDIRGDDPDFMSQIRTMTLAAGGVLLPLLLLAACGNRAKPEAADESAGGSMKVRVGYIGLTCEAPIFTAMEKGFFKEEGLEVSLVKCEWANYKDVLALGGFDVTHHLVMYFLKPIEQGLDVKFTGGIHRGCLRVQASTKGEIRTVADLRGKRIGVPGMGTPPFIFENRVLGAHGIDPSREITWLV